MSHNGFYRTMQSNNRKIHQRRDVNGTFLEENLDLTHSYGKGNSEQLHSQSP